MINNPIFAQYEAHCSHEQCGKGHIRFAQAQSCGLQLGDVIQPSSDPSYGRCHLCLRYSMKVTKLPPRPEPPPPEGFSRIPET